MVVQAKQLYQPKPIVVRGTTYPSMTACAKALGVTLSTVSQAVRRGALDTIGTGHRNMSKRQRQKLVQKKDVETRIKYDRQLNRIE